MKWLLLLLISTPSLGNDLDNALLKRREQALAVNAQGVELPELQIVDDATFVRRVYHDATGRLAKADEVLSFLQDSSVDKRKELINRLLDSPEWKEKWFRRLASMLRLVDEVEGVAQQRYAEWLRAAAANNVPVDELVRTLLTASGSLRSNAATGFMLRDHGWLTLTVTELSWCFLDMNLECAQCHDHPFDDWTQLGFYRFAAHFGETRVTAGLPMAAGLGEPLPTPRRSKSVRHEERASPFDKAENRAGSISTVMKNELWPSALEHSVALREQQGTDLQIADGFAQGLLVPPDYRYKDAVSGTVVEPQVMGRGFPKKLPQIAGKPMRLSFADWLVQQPRFAARMGLMVFEELFLRGADDRKIGGEPMDAPPQGGLSPEGVRSSVSCGKDCRDTLAAHAISVDDPANTEVATALAALVRERGFDMREVQRQVMLSEAYQRTATSYTALGQPHFHAGPTLRRLSPEAVWDSLVTMAGGAELNLGRLYSRDLPQRLPPEHPLRILGRGCRDTADDGEMTVSHGLIRWMLNGELPRQAARGLASSCRSADEVFLAVLARHPTVGEAEDLGSDLQTLASALLSSAEFLFLQ